MTRGEILVRLPRDKPAIAVESAFLSAGLPTGRREEAARQVRKAARNAGAEACFVGVVGGTPIVGLDDAEVGRVIESGRKANVGDLAAAMAQGADAGTTVSASLHLAHGAGIQVLVTGGIGGVHPSPGPADVSADLYELARTPCVVVCSGVKAFLNTSATLEHLETLGVPLVGFGTEECPAFWSRESGFRLRDRAETAADVVARWRALRELGRSVSLVVCVPPPEQHAVSPDESEHAVARALRALEEADIVGADVTPFLLSRIAELTEGRSVQANLALLEDNAGVAARIAVALRESRA